MASRWSCCFRLDKEPNRPAAKKTDGEGDNGTALADANQATASIVHEKQRKKIK